MSTDMKVFDLDDAIDCRIESNGNYLFEALRSSRAFGQFRGTQVCGILVLNK